MPRNRQILCSLSFPFKLGASLPRADSVEFLLRTYVQGAGYIMGQRLRACFVLKFALQRGEGRDSKFQIKAHRTFDLKKYLQPCRLKVSRDQSIK